MSVPVLYSFRRCPYAIRARMALRAENISYELREVLLKNKPAAMLDASHKGTVPVLLRGHEVIDESLDVMRWACRQNPVSKIDINSLEHPLVDENDGHFKYFLDRYKYFERYPQAPQEYYFQQAQRTLDKLETVLQSSDGAFILGAQAAAVDMAIFPFVRQFAFVDKNKFDQLPLPNLQAWLNYWLSADLFAAVMPKNPPWQEGDERIMIDNEETTTQYEVVHLPAENLFVIELEGDEKAILRYQRSAESEVDIVSTLVPTSYRGQGLAGQLVDAAFAWVDEQGYGLKTSCWYAEKRRARATGG